MRMLMRLTQLGKIGAIMLVLPTPIGGFIFTNIDVIAPAISPGAAAYNRALDEVTGRPSGTSAIMRMATINNRLIMISTLLGAVSLLGAVLLFTGREYVTIDEIEAEEAARGSAKPTN